MKYTGNILDLTQITTQDEQLFSCMLQDCLSEDDYNSLKLLWLSLGGGNYMAWYKFVIEHIELKGMTK